MRVHLGLVGIAALGVWSPLAVATPAPAAPTLASQTPFVRHAILAGVLRFRGALQKGGMLGVTGDVSACYRPADVPGKEFQLLICLAEDDAGYVFSIGAAVTHHFPPLPYYRRPTYYARQNEMVTREQALPAKLHMSFINTTLDLVTQEMQVVMGPPHNQ